MNDLRDKKDDWVVGLIKGVFIIVFVAIVFAIAGIVTAIPVYFLWNWLMPTIFGLKVIGFWQAWGLVFLSALLFKSYTDTNKDK